MTYSTFALGSPRQGMIDGPHDPKHGQVPPGLNELDLARRVSSLQMQL